MTRTALLLSAAAALACARGPAPLRAETAAPAADPPAPGVVDAATALALAGKGARVVDVRTPAEFAEGHVPGAVNVPFDEIARRAGEVGPKDAPVVLYCRSGRRSGVAAETLRALGYTKVYDAQRYDALAAAGGR